MAEQKAETKKPKNEHLDFAKLNKAAQLPEELKPLQEKLEKFSKQVLDKFDKYILGVTLLPPNKNAPKDVNVLVVVDDSDSSKMPKHELANKLSSIIADMAKQIDPNFKVQTWIASDLWQDCHDGKYERLMMVAQSQPIYDRGPISGIKISEVHKSMSLEKFEKYIVCYVCVGSHFRGEGNIKSDIDAFVVIDDTDVKRMSRGELKDKLTAIMYDMVYKAAEITGVNIKLHVQTYLLTDFWDSVKDANPVIFTFLRDGIPFFDRGMFMPWKQLLKMGKIKPSAESIDIFQSSGKQFLDRAKHKILSAGVEDCYYAILNPSQAALMMYGINPSTPRETARLIREIFVDKEKMLEKKYADIIEEQVGMWKKYEYEEVKSLDGAEAARMIKNVEDYLDRIKKLYDEIEVMKLEEAVLNCYDNVVSASRDVLKFEGVESSKVEDVPKHFKEKMINKGYFPEKTLRVLEEVMKAKEEYKKNGMQKHEVEKLKKESHNYVKFMVEFIQRKRANELDKNTLKLKYEDDKFAEVVLFKENAFIVRPGTEGEKEIEIAQRSEEGGLKDINKSDIETFEKHLAEGNFAEKVHLKSKLFEDLRDLFGSHVEVMVHN